MCFENFCVLNVVGGKSNLRGNKGEVERYLIIENSYYSRKVKGIICKN